jgi:hypothetical protein
VDGLRETGRQQMMRVVSTSHVRGNGSYRTDADEWRGKLTYDLHQFMDRLPSEPGTLSLSLVWNADSDEGDD